MVPGDSTYSIDDRSFNAVDVEMKCAKIFIIWIPIGKWYIKKPNGFQTNNTQDNHVHKSLCFIILLFHWPFTDISVLSLERLASVKTALLMRQKHQWNSMDDNFINSWIVIIYHFMVTKYKICCDCELCNLWICFIRIVAIINVASKYSLPIAWNVSKGIFFIIINMYIYMRCSNEHECKFRRHCAWKEHLLENVSIKNIFWRKREII